MIRILKDENAKLKESILAISTAAYRSQRELKDAITEACRIAELNPSGSARDGSSPQHIDDDLEHSSVVEHSPRSSSAQPLSSSYPQLGSHHHHGSSSSAWPASSLEMRSSHADTAQPGLGGGSIYSFDPAHNHSYVNNSHADMFAAAQPMTHMNTMPIHELRPTHSSSFSSIYSKGGYADSIPRGKTPEMMHYESSMQTYMPSRSSPTRREHGSSAAAFPAQPPDDIIAYLGPRAYTIAGQVYWATLGYAWQVLRSLDATYPAPSSDTLTTIYNLFHVDATSPQSIAVIKDHLYRRLAFRKQRASSIPPTQQQQQQHHHAQPQLQPPPGLLRDRSMGSSSSTSTLFDASGGALSSSSSSLTPPTPQHHSAGMMSMESLLSSSTTIAGLDPNAYISALTVEEQLRHMLGPSNALDLETALRNGVMINGGCAGLQSSASTTPTPTPPQQQQQQYSHASISGSAVPGGGNPTPGAASNVPGVVPAKQLLHTMARQAVFFADGPRWHPESVASAASMWSMEWQ